MRPRSMIAIVIALAVALPAVAQNAEPPWEVRTYLSTYTDDGSASRAPVPNTDTWTWNMTAVRKQWVCPYCGYSTFWEDGTPGDDVCPNPFGVAGHPANLELVEADAKTRILGRLNVTAADADNDEDHPLIGRPFHPGGLAEPVWNANPSPWEGPAPENVASYLTARAANLDSGAQPLVQNGYQYIDSGENVSAAAVYYMTSGNAGTAAANQYVIHINPYRVSDGDVWYIRHHEERQMGAVGYETSALEVQAYSTLYGNEFESAGGITAAERTNYDTQNGCQIITNSGALRVEIPRQYDTDAVQTGTWLIKVVIRSNTRTIPSPDEVDYNNVYGTDLYTDPGEVEPDFAGAGITADMSTVKAPYIIVDTTKSPLIATADANDGVDYPVEEKQANGDGFISDEAWPYRMPPEAVGVGRILAQWSEATPSVALQSYRPVGGGIDTFYRNDAEWH